MASRRRSGDEQRGKEKAEESKRCVVLRYARSGMTCRRFEPSRNCSERCAAFGSQERAWIGQAQNTTSSCDHGDEQRTAQPDL